MTSDQYIIGEWDRIEKARGPILAGETNATFDEISRNLNVAVADVQAAMLWRWHNPT